MSEEGKISRALSKSGSGERLTARQEDPETQRLDDIGPSPSRRQQIEPPKFHRVTGCCGQPASSVVMVHDRGGEAASQIRAVRARILSLSNGEPPTVIAITSGAREEGKSTMAFNLAAALSEVEARPVLLVDGDLAKPSLHALANLTYQKGLNETLEDSLSLDGSIYETTVPHLDIMPSRHAENPEHYEDLLTQNCAQLIAKLRKHYSFVIVDTPPVLAGSLACVFGKHCDGVLLIARLEKTPREVVERALAEVTSAGAKVLGCILTDRKHHIPNAVYRLLGTRPGYYYYGYRKGKSAGARSAAPEGGKKA